MATPVPNPTCPYPLADYSRVPAYRLRGDANQDGRVDSADVAAVRLGWNPTGEGGGVKWDTGDLNADGKVDASDVVEIRMAWDPLALHEAINVADVRQGYGGDCWFLAALASLANANPLAVRAMCAPLGDGLYQIAFRNGTAPFVVDSWVPEVNAAMPYAKISGDGDLWVALIEKGLAYRMGGYPRIYAHSVSLGVKYLTGGRTFSFWMTSAPANWFAQIHNALAAKKIISACSQTHAYALVAATPEMITLYDPFGQFLQYTLATFKAGAWTVFYEM